MCTRMCAHTKPYLQQSLCVTTEFQKKKGWGEQGFIGSFIFKM